MKIKGKAIEAPSEEVIVFPRESGNIVFKARPVSNYEDFNKICPEPLPRATMSPGGETSLDVEDPGYKKALDTWAEQKTHWMIIKSLDATDDIEWETVNMSDPATYKNYIQELEDSGITAMESAKLFEIIQTACGLNQDKIDEATAAFLAGEAEL